MTGNTTPDLLYSAEEDALRDGVRDLLAERSPHARILDRIESDNPYDRDLWHALAAQIGVAGLAVPEGYGGAGASWRETAVVAEELGRSVAPTPFLGSAVLATAALLTLTDETGETGGTAGDLLRALASGDATATLAVPLSPRSADTYLDGARLEGGRLVDGITSVADAAADTILVPAVGDEGPALLAVACGDVAVTPVVSLDPTRPVADLAFDGTAGEVLATGATAERAVLAAVTAGAGLLASEQLGLAEQCLDSTVTYLKERHQFGRPVGSFQALKHRLADVWVSITQARAAARYAAACLSSGADDTRVAVAVAASYCGDVAVHAAEECVQMHGGIGFTWEHPAHLYLKRAKADALALGQSYRHRAVLGSLVDLTM